MQERENDMSGWTNCVREKDKRKASAELRTV